LPSVAFCWLVGCAAHSLWRLCDTRPKLAIPGKAFLGVLGFVLASIGTTSIVRRNEVWRDDFTLYSTTLRTDPDSYVMHLNLGTTYFAMRSFSAAEKELQLALRLKPDSPNVLNALGCVFLEEGRMEDSARSFQSAIADKPGWTDSHFNYGRLLTKLGQNDAALAEFRTAVAVGPLNSSAHLYLGQALAERGEASAAEAELRESIRLFPSLSAQKQLADLLLQTGRATEALPLLDELAVKYPYDGATHLKLAQLLERLGKPEAARTEYRKTLESDPANSEARAALKRIGDVPIGPGR